MRLDGFDMNLLKVFRALWDERSVSRAAERLNLSQSATSAALGRLRLAIGDELFDWDGRAMQPTSRAVELAEDVRKLLEETSFLLAEADHDLTKASRSFVIASFDHIERMIGPPLLARLRKDAPNLTISVMNATSSMISGSGARVADLFILPEGTVPQGCSRPEPLYRDHYVGVISPGLQDRSGGRLTSIDELPINLPLVNGPGRPNQPGVRNRHVQRYTSAHFGFLSDYVAAGQLLAVLPRHVALGTAKHCDVSIVEFPSPVPISEVLMHWRPVYERDPFHQWLRNTIRELCAEIQSQIDAHQHASP